VSNAPAGVVIVSWLTTLDEIDDLTLTPVWLFLASNCARHVLPTARGRRTPWPSFGLNFQTMLSLRSQSRPYTTRTEPGFPVNVQFVTISLGDISVTT